jgi:hypothetical protein
MKRFLLTSQLASYNHLHRIGVAFQQMRTVAENADITGLLVFDGVRFCHYLEGPVEAVDGLVSRIKADDRHKGFLTLIDSCLPGERVFRQWSMAYSTGDETEPLAEFDDLHGEAALQRLIALIPSLDSTTDHLLR